MNKMFTTIDFFYANINYMSAKTRNVLRLMKTLTTVPL